MEGRHPNICQLLLAVPLYSVHIGESALVRAEGRTAGVSINQTWGHVITINGTARGNEHNREGVGFLP